MKNSMTGQLSYAQAGVNIDVADATKQAMRNSIDAGDPRVLNRLGAFASLVEGRFAGYTHPVLVLKTEEPGSKQKLAFQYGRAASIAYDLINHLINDIMVMGAEPLYVQDCIICGTIEPEIVNTLVASMSAACRAQGCALVGGETSEQPGVVEAGLYILSASIVGVVEHDRILDGARIQAGDCVLAVASNGLHTNGYSLVRLLMTRNPDLITRQVEHESFLDWIMRPHTCYYQPLRDLFSLEGLHGLAHITGGGIQGNLNRILPQHLDAQIECHNLRVLPIFKAIRDEGEVTDAEMLRTFNMGVGLTIVCDPASVADIVTHLTQRQVDCYPLGAIVPGSGQVRFEGNVVW